MSDFNSVVRVIGPIVRGDYGKARFVIREPADLLIVYAGGAGGSWSACLPGWGNKWTRSVTEQIGA